MDEILEQLGLLVDSCENYIALTENTFMSPITRAEALHHGMKEVRDKVKEIYLKNGGEDVWDLPK